MATEHRWYYSPVNGFWVLCDCGWQESAWTDRGRRKAGEEHVARWRAKEKARAESANDKLAVLMFITRLRNSDPSPDLAAKLDVIEAEWLSR